MVHDLLALIYPSVCINCNLTLIREEKYICTKCKVDLPRTNDTFYEENQLYKKFSFNPAVKGAASFLYFSQKGIVQKLLHKLKYEGKRELAAFLGKEFANEFSELSADFILPVPIHKQKLRKRGYNQSTEIAKGISEIHSIEIREDLISRESITKSQTKKSKVARWQNLENVYSEASDLVKGKKILIVDDVITTGATVGMLCDRLIQKGVSEIYIASIARGK